jgi:outer membrane biosynthesis protein TonB
MATDTSRVLRLGVVFRGQIIAERVLDKRQDVSVGSRPDSTLHVTAKEHPGFPAHVPLAIVEKDVYYAVLPDDPKARLSLRGGPEGYAGITNKDVVNVRNKRAVPIDGFTGGSLQLSDGETILMFQFVRGDSVPTVTHERTVLRLGLVYESRLLTDRLFDEGSVGVGAGRDDTIVLPDVEYKGASARFEIGADKRVKVRLPKGSGLKLAGQGSPLDEAEAVRKGQARIDGDHVELTIGIRSRGRVTLGPYTLLFQVLRQSVTIPVMPRRSVIGQLMAPLVGDPVWAVSFLVSALCFLSVVGQAVIFQRTTGKYLEQTRLEEIVNSTYEVVIEEQEEPEPIEEEEEEKEEVDVKSEEAKKEEQKEVEKEDTKKPEPKKEEPPQSLGKEKDPAERKRLARETIAKKTIAGAFQGAAASKLFGVADDGEAGTVVAKTFGGGGADEGSDLNAGVDLAGTGGGGGTVEKVDTGKRKGFKRSDKATKVSGPTKREKKVKISLNAGSLGGSGPAKTEIAKVIRRKNRAIQRCYEAALRENPNVGGKVAVSFVVGTAGTVTSVRVSGATGSFQSCIVNKFKRIRGLPRLPAAQTFNQSYVFTKS